MSRIPPEMARKFLRAAVLGMVQEGTTLHEARQTFDLMFCRVAKKQHGTQLKAAPKIGISRNTYSRIMSNFPQ